MVAAAVCAKIVEAKLVVVCPQSVVSAVTARAAPTAEALASVAQGRLAAAGKMQCYIPELVAALRTPAASLPAYP